MSSPRRPRAPRKPAGPRSGEQIRVPQVRLIDQHGQQLGIVDTADALRRAEAAGLDLVEVAAAATPPVCRIADLGKLRYEAERAERARKRTRAREPHQLRLRPNIADHDLDVKLKAARRFLAQGDQVRFQVQLRGRQRAHPQAARVVLERVLELLGDEAQIVTPLKSSEHGAHLTIGPRRS